jgi:hypothetical protein
VLTETVPFIQENEQLRTAVTVRFDLFEERCRPGILFRSGFTTGLGFALTFVTQSMV